MKWATEYLRYALGRLGPVFRGPVYEKAEGNGFSIHHSDQV